MVQHSATSLILIFLFLLIQISAGLKITSIALLLLGTQCYILFNVIAGASANPAEIKGVCGDFI